MSATFHDCWFLTGATAVGKTAIGVALAQRLGAEIISLDSMAIYRGMDIGTAKASPETRELVPHHLIDIADPSDEYSVAQYVDAAAAAVTDIRNRGKEPLFVGGTPLYLKSLLRGLFDGPPADWKLRREIEAELPHVGSQALFDRLAQVDPIAASNIHPNDTRRLIRALEVYRATGEPISHQQMQFEEGRAAQDCHVFVLRRQREELHQRIEARVRLMVEAGLVDEVRGLTQNGRELSRTARQAVGYNEALNYLNSEYDHDEMIARIIYHTRRFAKRQGTWFRSLSECRFIDISGDPDPTTVASEIADAI
ncbi:MAG TPA: tRNA (adenosine(37)-N6)-dimethylallyltransferase MiaA [Lacipirellulaceae bacterium]|jgi:tRNA dimethylallyltransferase|nr:tRNA (adenosine(37)-N6)-dimethylallyltransferase MiaA [Lacipirellulaceae bacterium]